jgi:hypothetical protein
MREEGRIDGRVSLVCSILESKLSAAVYLLCDPIFVLNPSAFDVDTVSMYDQSSGCLMDA